MRFGVLLLLMTVQAGAQWTLQESHSTASLRGIHSLGGGVAWASGSNGTVLRTVDGGKNWQACAVPEGGEKLDFRGVQGFDSMTAIVMSSGTGDLSRLYKTMDGCLHWKLVATNPDKEGFWDALQADGPEAAYILGDSVAGTLRVWEWKEGWDERELELSYQAQGKAEFGEGSFAASNSVFELSKHPQVDPGWKYALRWASNTTDQAFFTLVRDESTATCEPCREEHHRSILPLAGGSKNSGTFSFSFRTDLIGVAVGGDYSKADASAKTAAMTTDGGMTWQTVQTLPHGYRSAVAYDATSKAWIAVGPNGTDVSLDDGRNWRPLTPGPGDAADADKHWNALSLPFVVGSHGRIGVLRGDAISGSAGAKAPLIP